jgi:hypothetical protein
MARRAEMKKGRPKPPLLKRAEQIYLPDLEEAEVVGCEFALGTLR